MRNSKINPIWNSKCAGGGIPPRGVSLVSNHFRIPVECTVFMSVAVVSHCSFQYKDLHQCLRSGHEAVAAKKSFKLQRSNQQPWAKQIRRNCHSAKQALLVMSGGVLQYQTGPCNTTSPCNKPFVLTENITDLLRIFYHA